MPEGAGRGGARRAEAERPGGRRGRRQEEGGGGGRKSILSITRIVINNHGTASSTIFMGVPYSHVVEGDPQQHSWRRRKEEEEEGRSGGRGPEPPGPGEREREINGRLCLGFVQARGRHGGVQAIILYLARWRQAAVLGAAAARRGAGGGPEAGRTGHWRFVTLLYPMESATQMSITT